MARAWQPLFAGSIRVGPRDFDVWWSSPDIHLDLARIDPNGGYWEAITYRLEPMHQIVLCASMRMCRYPDALLHEIMHAAFYESDTSKAEFWRLEEEAVERLTPGLLPVVLRMGWTPLPIPDGHAALARHARRIRRKLNQVEPTKDAA